MNIAAAASLAQTDTLSPVQRSVRDHFQNGGSFLAVGMVVLIIALMVAAAYAISGITQRATASSRVSDPLALFGSLLGRLGVTPAQCKLLEQVAREQSLPNPSVLLLSPAAFESSFHQWQSRRTPSPNVEIERETAAMISGARDRLFPTDAPLPTAQLPTAGPRADSLPEQLAGDLTP